MNLEFLYSLLIISLIFFILSSGFKFFLNLKQELDFSYIAIIIFGSYSGVIINNILGTSILVSILLAFLLSIIFTFLVVYLSSKLSEIYFVIGTLSLYLICINLARNLEITGGSMGISALSKNIFLNMKLVSNTDFLIMLGIITFFVLILLLYIKKTLFYKGLIGWGENEIVLKSLGIKVNIYKFFMIILTSFLAVLGGNMYSFYFMYIDPSTFWTTMLLPILIISLMSYKFKELGTLIVSIFIIFIYEYIRFIKIVDVTKLGFFREIVFSLLVMIIAYFIFKKTNFGREV